MDSLPRGASQNMPTAGSSEGLIETVADAAPQDFRTASYRDRGDHRHCPSTSATGAASPRASSAPLPPKAPEAPFNQGRRRQPVWEPRRRVDEEPSHTGRNILLALLGFAVAGGVLFFSYQRYMASQPAQTQAAQTAPAWLPGPRLRRLRPRRHPAHSPRRQPAPAGPQPATADAAAPAIPPLPSETPAPPPPVKQAQSVQPKAPPLPTDGVFQITATPAGAMAIFDKDSALKCATPCSMTLPAGRHTFVVQLAGYRDAYRIIDIPRDTGLIVNLERMSGILTISTNPPVSPSSSTGRSSRANRPRPSPCCPGRIRSKS